MSDSYSTPQIEAIRHAIKTGRQAMMQSGESPRLFASTFIRAGGLQLPGGELDAETRRRVESHIMVAVNEQQSKVAEQPEIAALIEREIARIRGEVERFQLMMHPTLRGFRLELGDGVAERTACRRFLDLNAYGMGRGVVPAHEIVVLPPCCDGVRWVPLYE